jgi:uncharacterized protein (UPF0335 family)
MTEGSNTIAGDKIKSVIDRVENLMQERKNITEDIREVFIEAKSVGLDPSIIRELIKLRAIERDARQEKAALLESYSVAAQLDLF